MRNRISPVNSLLALLWKSISKMRQLNKRLGFGELITQYQSDMRCGKNIQLPLVDLFRQSVCSRIAGHDDVNHVEWLAQDPTSAFLGLRAGRVGAWPRPITALCRKVPGTSALEDQKLMTRDELTRIWEPEWRFLTMAERCTINSKPVVKTETLV